MKMVRRIIGRPVKKARAILQRLVTPPLESFPNAPDLFFVFRDLCRHPDVERRPGGWSYKRGFYPDYITVGGASHAIFREAVKFCRGNGVDLGAGLWPLPGAVPVDVMRGPGFGRTIQDFSDGSLDYVFSSHCLEHIDDWQQALAEWVAKLKVEGTLFLYLPHPACAIWHPGSPFVGDGHKWVPTPEIVAAALERIGCNIVGRDDGPDAMFSFYVCARKSGTHEAD